MGHLLMIKCVHSRWNWNILASTSVPFRVATVQVPNLAHTRHETDNSGVQASKMSYFLLLQDDLPTLLAQDEPPQLPRWATVDPVDELSLWKVCIADAVWWDVCTACTEWRAVCLIVYVDAVCWDVCMYVRRALYTVMYMLRCMHAWPALINRYAEY
jgi:hypothetical protein